jgi:hypothetical protein
MSAAHQSGIFFSLPNNNYMATVLKQESRNDILFYYTTAIPLNYYLIFTFLTTTNSIFTDLPAGNG